MEISLYGSTGFIGSNFYNNFSAPWENDQIHCIPRWSRRPASSGDILYTISTTHNYNVFDDATFDVKTNLVVLTETLESWRHNNPNAIFTLISSWFVYGDEYPKCGHEAMKKAWNDMCGAGYYTRNGGATENDECHPRGFYSITKYCAEQLLISYAKTFGLKYRILRLGNVLGRDDKATAKRNAFQYLVNKMKNGEIIDVYEKGEFYRNYSHVDDICEAIHLVMTRGDLNSTYNVGNFENYRFIDMLNYAAWGLGYKIPYNFIDQKEFHKNVQAKSFMMDTTKLQDLGFVNKYDMKAMINAIL